MCEILGTEVGQFVLVAIPPDRFDRIEFRRIGRQARQADQSVRALDIFADAPAPVHGQAIPDDQQLAIQLPAQTAQEVDHLRRLDRAGIQSEVDIPDRHPSDGRQHLPVKAQLQDRGLAARRPGPHPMGPFTQARLVDEDDGAAFGRGVFFNLGHSLCFQSRIAASSRCRACPVGR